VDLQVGCAFAPCAFNIFGLNSFATAPDLIGDRQQRFELAGNRRTASILFNILNQLFIAIEMIGRDRAMDFMSKNAIVLGRNVAGDEFPLPSGKRTRPLQQNFRQLIQRLRRFRPKGHGPHNSGQSYREVNMRHRLRAPQRPLSYRG
jgi:hypothetical protein